MSSRGDERRKGQGLGVATVAWKVASQVRKDDVPGLAAELAFRFFLALFPFFIFLGAVGSLMARLLGVDNPADQAAGLLGSSLPEGANQTVRDVISDTIDQENSGLLSITVLAAIWAATGGTNALIKAMNRAYDVTETRPFWRRYLLALLLTLVAAPLMLVAFLVLVLFQAYVTSLANALGAGDAFRTAVGVLRWPVVALLISVVASSLYRFAPNLDLRWKWLNPGAVLFSIGWLLVTFLFGLYVSNFGSYSNTYGVLGGVAVLMIWFYMTGFAILLGAEVNAVIDQASEAGREEARPEKLRKAA